MRKRFVVIALLAIALLVPRLGTAQQLPDGVCAALKAERAKVPTPPSGADLGRVLNNAAWTTRATGIGLHRKTAGHICASKAGSIACDILMLPAGTYWDVFQDSDGAAIVTCGGAGGTIADYVAPVDPGTGPPPVDPPPSGDLTARVAALERAQAVSAAQIRTLQDQIVMLSAKVATLPTLEETLLAVVTKIGVNDVKTSTTYYHAHDVRGLKLQRLP